MNKTFDFDDFQSIIPLMSADNKMINKYLPLSTKITVKASSYILEQGEICEKIYYLHKGLVKIILFTKNGEEKLLWYGSESAIIGDVPYFHTFPSNAAIIAKETCDLCVFNKSTFSYILKNDPVFSEYLLSIMARKIRVLVNQVQDICFANPTTKISKILYLFAQQSIKTLKNDSPIKIYLTHNEIGSLTNIHRVTVTNVLTVLRRENIIDNSAKGTIVVKDMDELYQVAHEHRLL